MNKTMNLIDMKKVMSIMKVITIFTILIIKMFLVKNLVRSLTLNSIQTTTKVIHNIIIINTNSNDTLKGSLIR